MNEVSSGRPEDFVQSVARALRVLETVGAHPRLPVKAIARRCGLNLSTTYHLARTLAYEGYLERLEDGTYVAGPEVARRFYDRLAGLGEPRAAHDVLRTLTARTGYSSYLGRISGGEVVVADCVEGPLSPYLEEFERGLAVSAHATALGQALLVSFPARERRAYLAEVGLRPFTAHTRTDLETLDAALASLAPSAVVVEHGEFRDGVSCAATLVRPGPGFAGPVWAVVVSARGEDVPQPVREELLAAGVALAAAAA
ncbi:IclR family transcriptional regulator [Mumia sp. DW29H23]|uniref:IclR family transcriptional regulator n=1 Tax=Mumia sp. DW29H23 TaxID=3421241 RepID=UPI003D696D04